MAAFSAERVKDKQLVQVELVEAVVDRLFRYAKWFGTAVAIPTGIALFALTLLGWQEVRDIRALARKVQDEVKPAADAALSGAQESQQKVRQVERAVGEAAKKVEDLSAKLAALDTQSATSVAEATKRIEARVNLVDRRMSEAQAQIAEQQRKLTDTGELVKAIFSAGRLEQFDTSTESTRYVVKEQKAKDPKTGKTMLGVFMLLNETPIVQSVQIQHHIAAQPRNSYFVKRNLVILFWSDSLNSLGSRPLLVSYTADPTAKEERFKALSVKAGAVYADSEQLVEGVASETKPN